MKQTDPQLKLRLPPELMDNIRSAAEAARRPISSEIVARLEWSFTNDGVPFVRLTDLTEPIRPLKKGDILGGRLNRLEEEIKTLKKTVVAAGLVTLTKKTKR